MPYYNQVTTFFLDGAHELSYIAYVIIVMLDQNVL